MEGIRHVGGTDPKRDRTAVVRNLNLDAAEPLCSD